MKERDDLDFLRRENQFKKLALLIGAFTAITLLAAFYFYLQDARTKDALERSNAELELSRGLLAAKIDTLQQLRRLLEESNRKTEEIKDSLTDALANLQKRVNIPSTAVISKDVSRILTKSANSRYKVQLVGYGVDPKDISKVHAWIERQGYVVVEVERLRQPEKWLPKQSTVYYYDEQSSKEASQIALNLGQQIRQKILTTRGTNTRYAKGYDASLIAVHLVK
ncbi:MAG: hypothetical protein OEQ53_19300 [Saprospiraceae bacterium]|nr:hypothetical protein [Saprospiraceae bacterium]